MREYGLVTEEKEYRKKPVLVKAYQTDKEMEIETLEGVMKADVGDFIITGIKGEQYPCKPDIFHATYDLEEDTCIDDYVIDNLTEWAQLITELSRKEIDLYKGKKAYEKKSEALLKEAAKHKAETGEDIIKDTYGGNNDKTRKKYVTEMLKEDAEAIKTLEFSIDYCNRRKSFLKQLVHTKTALLGMELDE